MTINRQRVALAIMDRDQRCIASQWQGRAVAYSIETVRVERPGLIDRILPLVLAGAAFGAGYAFVAAFVG